MLNQLAQKIHANNVSKGFYETEKNIGEMLCLIHSEVSEALEADREGRYMLPSVDVPSTNTILDDPLFIGTFRAYIKGSFEEEMADIIIRVLDLCAFKNIDIEAHVKAKMRYNSLRDHKHGKKYKSTKRRLSRTIIMSALLSISVKGKDGKYTNFTVSIDDKTNQYGQNVTMYADQTKEQREAKEPKKYIGNGKVFWTDGKIVKAEPKQQAQASADNAAPEADDLPF